MTTRPRSIPHWWQWPTVLSLDAPAVVIVWQSLFAAVCQVTLRWPEVFVLGASVWLSYAADRWIEGWRLSPSTIQTPRHRFYHDHRWPVAIVWLAVLVTDVVVAFVELSRRELAAGALLLTPTLLYLLSHQLVHRNHPWRLPKELCVALLIAGGAAVFVLARPDVNTHELLVPVLVFTVLCFTNVALIAAWEEEVDERHGQESLARKYRHGSALSRVMPPAVLAAALVSACVTPRPVRVALFCCGVSAVLLALVDRAEPRIGRQLARVLADFVLLTPVIPLVFRLVR